MSSTNRAHCSPTTYKRGGAQTNPSSSLLPIVPEASSVATMQDSSPASSGTNETSFYTAVDSHPGSKSTAASSPSQERPCPYEDARQLPHELKNHCHIFLDERLYGFGINLLNSVLATSGVSRRLSPSSRAVSVPPPTHLALLVTLLVHPLYTTRAKNQEHLGVPSQALDYLRSLLTIVGPINADFKAAVQFSHVSRSRNRHFKNGGNGSNGEDSDSGPEFLGDQLSCSLANDSGLWRRAPDFWTVLGWAMNCSATHPRRWRYWQPWLEFMLDLMEADWEERERIDEEAQAMKGLDDDDAEILTSRQDSIIAMYMDQQTGRQGSFKTFIKAMFAYGGDISTSSFKEVFEDELRGPKKQSGKRKRDALDVENGHFADYFEDEDAISSGGSQPPTPQKPRTQRREAFGAAQPGVAESIDLRLRIFKLVSQATWSLRKPIELEQLYEDATAALKVLPLSIFSLIMSQRESTLFRETHITFTRQLLLLLVPSSAKDPGRVDPEYDAVGALTMVMLEKCFVLHAANSVDVTDNAKLSLVVEKAIQLLWLLDVVEPTENFARAVETGILARDAKVKKRRTGKNRTDPCDSFAEEVLDNSAQRIRLLMEAMSET